MTQKSLLMALVTIGIASAFQTTPPKTTLNVLNNPKNYEHSLKVTTTTTTTSEVVNGLPTTTATQSSSSSSSPFDNFDYMDHWYPVSWLRDLPVNKPTKVTVFDVDYVVSRVGGGSDGKTNDDKKEEEEEVIAVVDRCPHKSASLSEGRVTSCGRRFQCAYHGWSFDGKDGTCVEIPQTVSANKNTDGQSSSSSSSFVARGRADATAVPAMVSQGMVWIFPGGNLEKALLAPPPPQIPEIDMPGFRAQHVVRDFPVDWSILIENILDPDHGLFAHQSSAFDLYTASSTAPQTITEEWTDDGKGWSITSRVDAVEKLIEVNKVRKGTSKDGNDSQTDTKPKKGTSVFHAPSTIATGRRDENGEAIFVIGFWICPTGTGRSRFMSASIGKTPFTVPRWLSHIALNNFLDQDTYLLATQQRHVLEAEARETTEANAATGTTNARKKLYVYRSPTEKMGVKLASFFDATLPRAPNRLAALQNLKHFSLLPAPSRDAVLDRHIQHTRVCPDSMDVVENCDRAVRASKITSLLVVLAKVFASLHSSTGSSEIVSRVNDMVKPIVLGTALGLSALTAWIAKKIRKQFSFKYEESYRDRDMDKIPNVWADPA